VLTSLVCVLFIAVLISGCNEASSSGVYDDNSYSTYHENGERAQNDYNKRRRAENRDTTSYTSHPNDNAFNGHGGVDIDSDSSSPVRMTVSQCQQRCTDDPACDCVTYAPNGYNSAWGRCWKRKQCEPSKFKHGEGIFDVYMKSSSAAAKNKGKNGDTTSDNFTTTRPHKECPSVCRAYRQKEGYARDYRYQARDGTCLWYISRWNWCGSSYLHREGGINCRACAKYYGMNSAEPAAAKTFPTTTTTHPTKPMADYDYSYTSTRFRKDPHHYRHDPHYHNHSYSCGVPAGFEITAIVLLISLVATTAASAYLLRQIEQAMPEVTVLPPGKMVTQSNRLVPSVSQPIISGNSEKTTVCTA